MDFILRLLLLGASIGHLAVTNAQTSDAVCRSDWSWALNSRQQTPCQVAAYLLAPCANNR
ncbi:hypothetical protein CPB86DRAFT_411183 [Serendipita vermifera]|nr:hypothetical protein CPB86DRAFT_411183 [Serendipita vermifera]